MAQVRSWAGLDVHRASVLAATMDRESAETRVRRLGGEIEEIVAFCAGLPGPVRVAYEAGPTGFGLARALSAAGVGCVVAAPGKIERPASDRVKTACDDGRPVLLARSSPAPPRRAQEPVRCGLGQPRICGVESDANHHPLRVPTVEEEALRDLVRAREDVRGDLMRARHRLSKLLLRHDVRFDGTAGRGRRITARGLNSSISASAGRRRRSWTTSALSTR